LGVFGGGVWGLLGGGWGGLSGVIREKETLAYPVTTRKQTFFTPNGKTGSLQRVKGHDAGKRFLGGKNEQRGEVGLERRAIGPFF